MKSKKPFHFFLSCIFALSVLSFAGCGDLELSSRWRNREITIDGVDSEWQNVLLYVEKANASVGVVNDERYLYICLASVDRQIAAQMAGLGFTVWFDPKGGNKKTLGIHFPLGSQQSKSPIKKRARVQGAEERQNPEEMFRKMVEELGNEIEIIGPDKDQCNILSLLLAKGIEVKLGYSKGRLVYELKVPLAQSIEHPYAIGTDMGKTIGIGLETPELDREKMGQMRSQRGGGMGGMSQPGGSMGGSGGPGGGMGGPPRGGMRQGGGMSEPLELWVKVRLASDGSSTQE